MLIGIVLQFKGSYVDQHDFSIDNINIEKEESFYHTQFEEIPEQYYEKRSNSFVTQKQKENQRIHSRRKSRIAGLG